MPLRGGGAAGRGASESDANLDTKLAIFAILHQKCFHPPTNSLTDHFRKTDPPTTPHPSQRKQPEDAGDKGDEHAIHRAASLHPEEKDLPRNQLQDNEEGQTDAHEDGGASKESVHPKRRQTRLHDLLKLSPTPADRMSLLSYERATLSFRRSPQPDSSTRASPTFCQMTGTRSGSGGKESYRRCHASPNTGGTSSRGRRTTRRATTAYFSFIMRTPVVLRSSHATYSRCDHPFTPLATPITRPRHHLCVAVCCLEGGRVARVGATG